MQTAIHHVYRGFDSRRAKASCEDMINSKQQLEPLFWDVDLTSVELSFLTWKGVCEVDRMPYFWKNCPTFLSMDFNCLDTCLRHKDDIPETWSQMKYKCLNFL